jgi:hypothetical protein
VFDARATEVSMCTLHRSSEYLTIVVVVLNFTGYVFDEPYEEWSKCGFPLPSLKPCA